MSALSTLLDGLVDYAGLFPPAALPMDAAVRNYAAYRAGAQRGMLARFVLPAARLDEFVREASALEPDGSAWPLSVLAGPGDAPAIGAFNRAHGARWLVDTIEAKATTADDVAALAAAFGRLTVYVEIPVDDALSTLVQAIAQANLRAKIRTGGVTRDAFPAPEAVLRFLAECTQRQVPFKATAGLHHPLRGEYPLTYAPDAERGTMYGFLNVFLAATLLHAGHAPATLLGLIEERDAAAIVADANGISWRGLHASAAQVAQARARFAGSFGSCSFEEPVQDLAALQLLPPRQ
ncbi:MAG TPA: hypothetical protein PLY94_01170 [Gemmatimonadaceae bacterium]|nr:hypothetical protein [Gemmatimonadaceae bacterium]